MIVRNMRKCWIMVIISRKSLDLIRWGTDKGTVRIITTITVRIKNIIIAQKRK